MQRLTSSSVLLSSRDGESDDMWGYLMVIRTFLLILTREVRWQVEIPRVVIRTNTLLLILTREVW